MSDNIMFFMAMGLVAGICAGLFGIGGATILIPIMVYTLGMSQHSAQGTAIALMVPPIGLLAAWRYYSAGYIDIKMASFVCIGFFVGGLIGAQCAISINDTILRRLFGVFLFVISLKMILSK